MIAAIYSNHGSRAWRHIDPEQHLLEACDIPVVASVLAEATVVQDGTLLAELLSRAEACDRDAMADVGKHLAALDRSGEDLALSWIALAALDGHARSAVLMAVVCVREAACLETHGRDDVDGVLRWLRKARHWTRDLSWERWFRHAYEDYLAGESTAADIRKDLATVAPGESRLFLRGQRGSLGTAMNRQRSSGRTRRMSTPHQHSALSPGSGTRRAMKGASWRGHTSG